MGNNRSVLFACTLSSWHVSPQLQLHFGSLSVGCYRESKRTGGPNDIRGWTTSADTQKGADGKAMSARVCFVWETEESSPMCSW
ncbi:hypothetical protein CDAR_100451 [Caerostris darwini]|uniref:Secreted protein n=1 Tax=Caerostris darwini TaxID=1538125 RepID=A0AAV4X5M1_9ARAC|nr:hypothetical protein CDAR_100451 [Caerostris darwini]